MLGVEFEKIKNVTFLIYNEGTFFSKKDFQLHSSFKDRLGGGVIYCNNFDIFSFKTVLLPVSRNLPCQAFWSVWYFGPELRPILTQVQVISIPPRSTQKWCQIIHLGLVSMALKFFVIILIFGGSRAKNAWFIMYIIYIVFQP